MLQVEDSRSDPLPLLEDAGKMFPCHFCLGGEFLDGKRAVALFQSVLNGAVHAVLGVLLRLGELTPEFGVKGVGFQAGMEPILKFPVVDIADQVRQGGARRRIGGKGDHGAEFLAKRPPEKHPQIPAEMNPIEGPGLFFAGRMEIFGVLGPDRDESKTGGHGKRPGMPDERPASMQGGLQDHKGTSDVVAPPLPAFSAIPVVTRAALGFPPGTEGEKHAGIRLIGHVHRTQYHKNVEKCHTFSF